MSLPARATTGGTQNQAAPCPQVKRLKKGELLFAEGENSRAMYFLKSGMIRLYKKKGDSNIELDTVHTGQVLGELAFLDGNPRSASGEALTDCELVEVSGPTFQQVLVKMPEWLKILLKTVVGRLRTASTRIRQLESASTALTYGDKDGKRTSQYVFLSPIDVLKISTALLLVASRQTQAENPGHTTEGSELRIGLLQRYANQIMGIPVAKITAFLDVMAQVSIISIIDEASGTKYVLKDIDFLEQLIAYLNEENLLEPSKRHDISLKGFLILSLMHKHLDKVQYDDKLKTSSLNIAAMKAVEQEASGKEPFRIEDFSELVKLGYATNLNVKNSEEAYTNFDKDEFVKTYRLQRTCIAIRALNEQKSKTGGR